MFIVGLSFEGLGIFKYFCKIMFFSLMAWKGNFDYFIFRAGTIRHERKKLWKRPLFVKVDYSAVVGHYNLLQYTLLAAIIVEQAPLELQKSGMGVWPEKLKALKYVPWQGKRGYFSPQVSCIQK